MSHAYKHIQVVPQLSKQEKKVKHLIHHKRSMGLFKYDISIKDGTHMMMMMCPMLKQ